MIQTWTCPGCGTEMNDDCACAVKDIDFDELLCDDCQSSAQDIDHMLNDDSIFKMGVHRRPVDDGDGWCDDESVTWLFTSAGEKLMRQKMAEAFLLFTPEKEESFGRACGLIYH